LTGAEVAGDATSPRQRDSQAADAQRLARIVFAVLVVGCFAAFFLTQRLKHRPASVQRFQRSPTFAPGSSMRSRRSEHISFKLARADNVTVAIVDSRDDVVATLLRGYPAVRYKQLSLRWNGRRGTAHGYIQVLGSTGHAYIVPRTRGRLAPAGEYRVRVTLAHRDQEVLSPWSFRLERP
jgi:hypothetical protein